MFYEHFINHLLFANHTQYVLTINSIWYLKKLWWNMHTGRKHYHLPNKHIVSADRRTQHFHFQESKGCIAWLTEQWATKCANLVGDFLVPVYSFNNKYYWWCISFMSIANNLHEANYGYDKHPHATILWCLTYVLIWI
jgi:hypothetical protein